MDHKKLVDKLRGFCCKADIADAADIVEQLEAENERLNNEVVKLREELAQLEAKHKIYVDSTNHLRDECNAMFEQLATAQLDAARYRNHCRNKQIAAWMGLDPNASDALEQLDAAIDSAMEEVGHE